MLAMMSRARLLDRRALNDDGYLDIFAAGCCEREGALAPGNRALLSYSQVWLYNEAGKVEDSYDLGNAGSNGAALADLNGDGSLDAFLANGRTLQADGTTVAGTPNSVWFNDGEGQLDLLQLGAGWARVWLNDGRGRFSTGQTIRYGRNATPAVGDVTSDGRVDLFAADVTGYQVWRGVGHGRFARGAGGGYR